MPFHSADGRRRMTFLMGSNLAVEADPNRH
jgi:hypothetical protein